MTPSQSSEIFGGNCIWNSGSNKRRAQEKGTRDEEKKRRIPSTMFTYWGFLFNDQEVYQ